MKSFFYAAVVYGLFVSSSVFGSEITTNVKIKLLSIYSGSGQVLVQTEPRHGISGLDCTKDYWLMLNKNTTGYKETLAMLLTAYSTQRWVDVRADSNKGEDFCRLGRIVIKN